MIEASYADGTYEASSSFTIVDPFDIEDDFQLDINKEVFGLNEEVTAISAELNQKLSELLFLNCSKLSAVSFSFEFVLFCFTHHKTGSQAKQNAWECGLSNFMIKDWVPSWEFNCSAGDEMLHPN